MNENETDIDERLRSDFFREIDVSPPYKTWIVAFIAFFVILCAGLLIMQALGLFDALDAESSDKSTAAAIALVGTFLTASVTLIGFVVNYSIDRRNSQQAEVESTRNYWLAVQAQERNKLEADRNHKLATEEHFKNKIEVAISAVDLLSENGEDATTNQMAGAILALADLEQRDLAVTLLSQLWPNKKQLHRAAAIVLKDALAHGSDQTRNYAADVLLENARYLSEVGPALWPIEKLGWRTDLPDECRANLAFSTVMWIKMDVQTGRDIQRGSHMLPKGVVVLFQMLEDENRHIQGIAHASLKPVVENVWEWVSLQHPGAIYVNVEMIKHKLELTLPRPSVESRTFGEQIDNAYDQSALSKEVEKVHGVGPRKRRLLFREFGSIQNIRRASVRQIAALTGIDENLARTIKMEL